MRPESHQKHLLIIEDDKGSRQLLLDRPVYSIGRDRDCDIRLASFFVSRHHAMLVQIPGQAGECSYRIVDGDRDGQRSANGLMVNGRRLHAHDLCNEDKVAFGPQVGFTYYLLKRDTTPTTPPDELGFEEVTLINPYTAGDSGITESLPEEIRHLLVMQSRRHNLTGKVRRFLNVKREGHLKPKHNL